MEFFVENGELATKTHHVAWFWWNLDKPNYAASYLAYLATIDNGHPPNVRLCYKDINDVSKHLFPTQNIHGQTTSLTFFDSNQTQWPEELCLHFLGVGVDWPIR